MATNSSHLNGEGRGELLARVRLGKAEQLHRHREVRPATKGAGVVRAPAAVAGVAAAAARMLYGAMRFFKYCVGFHLFISKQS